MNVVARFNPTLPLAAPRVEEIFLTRPNVRVGISHNPKRYSFGGISVTVLGQLATKNQP